MRSGASSKDAQRVVNQDKSNITSTYRHSWGRGGARRCWWAVGLGSIKAHSWPARLGSGVKSCQQGGSPDTCLVSCLTPFDSATVSDANCCHTWSKGTFKICLNVCAHQMGMKESRGDGLAKVGTGAWGEKAELQCRGDERQESAYHLSIGVMFKTGLLSHLHLLLDSPSHSGKGLVRVSSLSTHSVMPMQFTEWKQKNSSTPL